MLTHAWQFLVSSPDPPTGAWDIIRWWEIRRIPYNIILAFAGIISLAIFYLCITASGHLKLGEDAVEPLALIAAPFVINILYTAGWVVELVLWTLRVRRPRTGPVIWVAGTVFSLLVVAVPSVFWGAVWILGLLGVKANW